MSSLSKTQQKQLTAMFGERLSFDKTERKLYGHDIAAMPSMIKPIIGDTTPDAVVQPTSEEKLVELMKWADKQHVALTPRGKATSGYGGVVPVKNGVVVDFYFMKDVISVDAQAQTVTVQPGISWEQLYRALKPHDLTLRLYPSSYPSSTVGGWLGQGGAGFGSYKYDYFVDNVVSARAVLPSGETRLFAGEDLALLAGAEGVTGFITEITVRVKALAEEAVMAIGCTKAPCLQRIIQEIHSSGLPISSISFINPRMAALKNEAPGRMHNGHAVEKHVQLPESYIITLAYDAADKAGVETGVEKILALCPCCEFQLRVAGEANNSDIEVVDLARFTAEALGYDFADPNPDVRAQWAVFEAMIKLMTPEGFAEVMRGMFPELVEAMPMGMGGMMKGMAKVPGALDSMKPMFPVLFPKLLPGMMPKVMPKMLELVAAKVPMPDYMAEQVPEMMPKVMDNLMPHMIGDVVPLISDDLIAYLKSLNGNGGGNGAAGK